MTLKPASPDGPKPSHHVTDAFNIPISAKVLRVAKVVFSFIGDVIRTGIEKAQGWIWPTEDITSDVWQLGKQLNKSAYHEAFDMIQTKHPGKVAVLQAVSDLETTVQYNEESIKETVNLAFDPEMNDEFVKQCRNAPVVAVPVRISKGNHIGLLVFDKAKGQAVWYDSRTSNPRSATVMDSDFCVADLAMHIWDNIPGEHAPEFELHTNTSKDQADFYNCGIHVIDCVDWLAQQENPDIFAMVDRKAEHGNDSINAKRAVIRRAIQGQGIVTAIRCD